MEKLEQDFTNALTGDIQCEKCIDYAIQSVRLIATCATLGTRLASSRNFTENYFIKKYSHFHIYKQTQMKKVRSFKTTQ